MEFEKLFKNCESIEILDNDELNCSDINCVYEDMQIIYSEYYDDKCDEYGIPEIIGTSIRIEWYDLRNSTNLVFAEDDYDLYTAQSNSGNYYMLEVFSSYVAVTVEETNLVVYNEYVNVETALYDILRLENTL